MHIELRATQKKAEVAHEDQEAFYRSLLALAARLQPAWQFRVSTLGTSAERLSLESLRKHFTSEWVKAKLNFLERQRQTGTHYSSIEHYVASTPDINEQKARRNYLRLLAWQGVKGKFLEALCLMATLARMTPIGDSLEIDLFTGSGPIRV